MLPLLPAPVPLRRRGLWWKARTRDNQRPAKRHRSRSEDTSEDDSYYIVEFTPELSPEVEPEEVAEDMEKMEDWEDLKLSFARATEQYESDNVAESLHLLRCVLRLCHRFLLLYPDPSVLYAQPRTKTPEPAVLFPISPRPRVKCKCRESPTAFHSILGTALFLFGNIILQDPSLVLCGEPSAPVTYWLAALDVFEMGENLPSRTSGRGCEAPEDWRMNIVWGRVILCIADATLAQQQTNTPEPKWSSPDASVFAAIQMRRSPDSRRISVSSAIPHELLLLAIDHLTQRLPAAADRMRWAAWADNVLGQIPAQGQTSTVARVRGRCWLVYGTAHVEDIEETGDSRGWDSDDAEIFDSEDAEDAREGLERAIGFFERAVEEGAEGDNELHASLTESLLTLANLTKEKRQREELYQRAQTLGYVVLDAMED
ncbi:hypothetical protein C8F01DRAFT_1125231 [Mycena amicta]|nr:hypothetical protein C8F01DRAFT_1125231 [Mycena amicta]